MKTTQPQTKPADGTQSAHKITFRKQAELRSQNYGVYRGDTLIEGGFFSRNSAMRAATAYELEQAGSRVYIGL